MGFSYQSFEEMTLADLCEEYDHTSETSANALAKISG